MFRRWSVALILLFAGSFASAIGPRQYLKVYDFSKGVDTYHGSTSLPDGFVQNSLNVLFDDVAPITKRHGYTVAWSTKSYSYTGLWTYTDPNNNTWHIVRSSDQITANNFSGSVVLITTVSINNTVGETNAFGNAYFVDQTQGVYYWNGSHMTQVASSPLGSQIVSFHNRVWVIGAAVPNGNQLYGSKYGDGTIWTTGLNATDPVQFSVGLQDNFDNVTAEYVYLDTLYLFKHSTIFGLYGFDQTSFQISFLTQECGCVDQNSIQTYNGSLKFVSLRGVEDFNGYTCKRISDPIKNKIDPGILTEGFSQQSWVLQSQSDWQSGTIYSPPNSLNTTSASPSLVLSTQAAAVFTDATQANWDAGTLSNMDTTSQAPGLAVNLSSTVIYDQGTSPSQINTANQGGSAQWSGTWAQAFAQSFTTTSDPYQQLTNFGMVICQVGTISTTLTVKLYSDNNGVPGSYLGTSGSVSGSGTGTCGSNNTLVNINLTSTVLSPSTKYWIYVPAIGTSANYTGWNLASSAYGATWGSISGIIPGNYQTFSATINKGRISYSPTSGSITSRVFDSGVSTGTLLFNWGVFNTSETDNGNTITYQTQVATATTGPWDAPVSVTPGSLIGSSNKRYIQYISSFNTTNVPSLSPVLSSVTLNTTVIENSSGVFKSPVHSFGSINSFGNFSVNQLLNNGSIAYSICASTTSNMSVDSCQTININSPITLSTGTGGSGTYAQWYSTFSVTNATQTPTLQSGTIQVFSGNRAPPMSSTVWDNRYWLSFSSNPLDSFNDIVEVLNTRGAWAPMDIHAGAFTQTKNTLYHADSLSSGNIYLDNQSYADNGNPINVFVQTKDYSFGDLPADEYLYVLYPTVDNQGSCPVTFQYMPDLSGTNYSLGSPLESEFAALRSVRLPFPIDSSHQDFGQSMNFTIGTSDSQCPFQFYGFEGIYKERQPQ